MSDDRKRPCRWRHEHDDVTRCSTCGQQAYAAELAMVGRLICLLKERRGA